MKDIWKLLLILVIGIGMGVLIMKQCQEDPNKALLKSMDENRQIILDSLTTLRKFYAAQADSSTMEQTIIKNYYETVYEQIDSLYNLDAFLVNAIIRFWADSIRQVLKITPDFNGTETDW